MFLMNVESWMPGLQNLWSEVKLFLLSRWNVASAANFKSCHCCVDVCDVCGKVRILVCLVNVPLWNVHINVSSNMWNLSQMVMSGLRLVTMTNDNVRLSAVGRVPNIWGPSWDNRESFSMWSLWIQLRLVHGSCQKTVVYKIATCHPGFCNPCAMQWTVWIAQNCCTVREKGWKHWQWIGAWLPLLIITTPPPFPFPFLASYR